MADEFLAHLGTSTQVSLNRIEHALCSSNRYILERKSETEIAFRLFGKVRQSDWPEDFALSFDGNDLLLTIHTGTKAERSEVLQNVQASLQRDGITISFESV